MSRKQLQTYLLPILAMLAGCTSMPTGPTVLALPGTKKNLDEFRADDIACRQFAAKDAPQSSPRDAQRRYDFQYMQCMYAKGHRVPVFGRYTSESSPPTTAPDTSSSPPPSAVPQR